MELIAYSLAYAVFILAVAAPFILAGALLLLLFFGFRRIVAGIKRDRRIDILGAAMLVASVVAGTMSYRWLGGPKAEAARLEPLVVDRQLAVRLPRTWVTDYGAAFDAFDLLPHKYANRVLNARITDRRLVASIPEGKHDAFMEEIKLVDSPSCNALIASGRRNASRTLECVARSAVAKADVAASGPYLMLDHDEMDDAQILIFALVAQGRTMPIARCIGRAPRETNPLLAMIRGNRSLEVASSMYECRMRAAAGALAQVIATGTTG